MKFCNGKNASQVGRDTQRNPQTVMEWVHRHHDKGPEAMLYRRSGGHTPPLLENVQRALDTVIRDRLRTAATAP